METVVIAALCSFIFGALGVAAGIFWAREAYEEELLYQLENVEYWKTAYEMLDKATKELSNDVL